MTKKLEEEFNLPPIEEAKKSDKKFDMPIMMMLFMKTIKLLK